MMSVSISFSGMLFQHIFKASTKSFPLFCSGAVVVLLWVMLEHALLEMPPKVLNRVKVW
jgi:hypothetical protein